MAELCAWQQRALAMAAAQPTLHPYTLALKLEVEGFRGISGLSVARLLATHGPRPTPQALPPAAAPPAVPKPLRT